MTTPLFAAMDRYVKKDTARFHMPGHKGSLSYAADLAKYDLTEVDGCDELYRPQSAIADTESRYAELYQSEASLLCAGGSTLCIQAMLALAVKPRGSLILGRGCHAAAINAMAMLDIEPHWVFPEYDVTTGLAKAVTSGQIREALAQKTEAAAVYITSPDYYGTVCDIPAIAGVCRKYGAALLVDNAHGAYTRFLKPSAHPVNLGADMCCNSLHKTLPVLTGGAMLHIGNKKFVPEAKRYMSVFGSTSPSYLIMMSADMALGALEGDFPQRLEATASELNKLRTLAKGCGFFVQDEPRDPLRLTLGFGCMGYNAAEFAELIRRDGIEPEMVSGNFCVLMATPYNRPQDFVRLSAFIENLPARTPLPHPEILTIKPRSVKSIRESVFAEMTSVQVENAAGRAAASAVSPCPPGIPIVVPGELIDENLIPYFKNYGILRINVVE